MSKGNIFIFECVFSVLFLLECLGVPAPSDEAKQGQIRGTRSKLLGHNTPVAPETAKAMLSPDPGSIAATAWSCRLLERYKMCPVKLKSHSRPGALWKSLTGAGDLARAGSASSLCAPLGTPGVTPPWSPMDPGPSPPPGSFHLGTFRLLTPPDLFCASLFGSSHPLGLNVTEASSIQLSIRSGEEPFPSSWDQGLCWGRCLSHHHLCLHLHFGGFYCCGVFSPSCLFLWQCWLSLILGSSGVQQVQ